LIRQHGKNCRAGLGVLLGLPVSLLLVFGLPVHAQTIQQQVPEIIANPSGEPVDIKSLTPEQIIYYLANEKVGAAGVGFINGEIGDPMASILNTWGEPVKKRKTGVLGSIEFMYQPDPNLYVVFTGQETVKTISIKGSGAALFRTTRGARFGMPPELIGRLYGVEGAKVKHNRAEFREIGVNFHFLNDRLDKVVIYEPKKP
jgi:hypothetical protein